MTGYGVVLFHTTSAVMHAEKLLVKNGYAVKLIPTPRQFSSDCGIALRFEWDRQEAVQGALENAGVEYKYIHPLDA